MVLSFFMPMNPPTVTHQEHKVTVVNGKPRFYEPAELKAARQLLSSHLAQHRPKKKITTGCMLTAIWCFPCGKHANHEPMIKKPDTDNLQKLLKDCMTQVGFWVDDALVFSETVMKFYNEPSGIYIKVETLDEE
jgi:Holliday junction resolvase RusA-like endonuclease